MILGVTHCDCCSEPIDNVGPLREEGPTKGYCGYCSKDSELSKALEHELSTIVKSWVATCARRGVDPRRVREVLEFGHDRNEYLRGYGPERT